MENLSGMKESHDGSIAAQPKPLALYEDGTSPKWQRQ
jgi:hypothetical protein